MDPHELSFGKIIILRNDLAEVIVNEGVEMDIGMAEELHLFLLSYFTSSFSILINTVNCYSLDFNALKQFGALVEIIKIAVVAYNRMAVLSAELMIAIPRLVRTNIKVFINRDEALIWL